MPSIAHTIAALKAKTIRKQDAVELLIPELDRIIAAELIPVAGEFIEAITDLLLPTVAGAIVNGCLRAWAKERAAAKRPKAKK